VPRRDLVGPLRGRAAEATNLDWHRLIREVSDNLSNPRVGEFRIAMGVCLTDHFLCVPCEPHLLFRVTSTQQTNETIMLIEGESLGCHAEPATHPPERIVLAASMTTRLVLHPSPALIEGGVREPHDLERG